jgi:hypothetical protein
LLSLKADSGPLSRPAHAKVWLLVSSDALVVFNGNHGDRSVAGTFSLDGKLITVSGGDGSRSSLGSAPFVTVETTLAFLTK